jgi:hypothetical protein
MARLFVLITLSLLSASTQAQAIGPGNRFPVFDATGFAQKPDLTQYGLRAITVVYPAFMWDSADEANLPDRHRLSAFARLASQSTDFLVIDIEQWPLAGDPAVVAESIKKYETVIQWLKQPVPPLRVGFYGLLPIRDYWDSLQEENSPRYLAWQKENDRLASIATLADVLFPSIYTFYEDRAGWQKYAIAQIQEARRYVGAKPVYVFLWPQYHVSNTKLANTFLPGDYWRMELETARRYADGIVIWCCANGQTWNDKAPWWLETQAFLKEVGPNHQ